MRRVLCALLMCVTVATAGDPVGPLELQRLTVIPSGDTGVVSGITPTAPYNSCVDFDAGATGTMTCMGGDADELLWQMRCDDGDNAYVRWDCTTDEFIINPGSGGETVFAGAVTGIGFDDINPGTNTQGTMTVGSGSALGFTGSGTINASTLEGTDFGTLTNGLLCTYDSGSTEIDCTSSPVSSLSFSAITSGTNTSATMECGSGCVLDLGAGSLEIPNGSNPTADDPGEIAHDTTANQIILDDNVFDPRRTLRAHLQDLTATDDDYPLWSPPANITLTACWCLCSGVCTTPADITLETRQVGSATVDAVGGTIDCEDEGTGDSPTTMTSDNTVDALDLIRMNVTNTPTTGDTYTLECTYTTDRS